MVDRCGKEVTTAVTNLDIHDIARSCKTYGVKRYFIVNPEEEQERLVSVILDHWKTEVSQVAHPSRAAALEIVTFARTFEEAFNEVAFESGSRPYVVMPDARMLRDGFSEPWSYEELRERLEAGGIPGDDERSVRPLMIVFGTGWGISPSFFGQVDRLLIPLRRDGLAEGERGYNHLSVRAAAAIVLDRVLGERNF
jgi:hypothetical protein